MTFTRRRKLIHDEVVGTRITNQDRVSRRVPAHGQTPSHIGPEDRRWLFHVEYFPSREDSIMAVPSSKWIVSYPVHASLTRPVLWIVRNPDLSFSDSHVSGSVIAPSIAGIAGLNSCFCCGYQYPEQRFVDEWGPYHPLARIRLVDVWGSWIVCSRSYLPSHRSLCCDICFVDVWGRFDCLPPGSP